MFLLLVLVLWSDAPLLGSLALRWQVPLPQTTDLAPAADRDGVYVPVAGGTLVAFAARDGQLRWRTELGGEISAAPVADGRAVYVASGSARGGHLLRALGAATGVALWQTALDSPARYLVASSDLLYIVTADGALTAIAPDSGQRRWRADVRASAPPLLASGLLYVGTASGDILALDRAGRVVARWRAASPPQRLAADAKGMLYCAAADGRLLAFAHGEAAPRWVARASAAVLALAATDSGCVAASLDNFVRAYARDGKRLWKRQLAGRVVAAPLVDRGVALFTPLAGDLAVLLDLGTGRALAFLPVPAPTAAPPLRAADLVLFTTRSGLLAFGPARP